MGIIKRIISALLVIAVLGYVLPALWPLMQDTTDAITGLSGGTETDILKAIWPIALIIIGIGIAAGVIFFALKQFGVIGRK